MNRAPHSSMPAPSLSDPAVLHDGNVKVPALLGLFGLCASSLLTANAAHAGDAAPTPAATAPDADGDDDGDGDGGTGLSAVTVSGLRSILHDKLGESAQDAPQSVTVVSRELMSQQATTRLEDALRNVPGITMNSGEGAARGDTVNLRGFSAFNDFFLDGVRDAAVYTRDSFDLDSVEVLKGPSAVLFGRGSTGGAINQVTKAPTLTPLEEVSAQLGTADLYRVTADLDQPLSATAAARLNLMGESSHVADRDDVYNRRWGVAPSVAFGIGEHDTLTLAYLHQQEDDVPDMGIPFVAGRPAPVSRDSFYGLSSDHFGTDVNVLTASYKHDFTDNVSIADTLRYGHYDFNDIFAAPNFGSNVPTASTPLASILVGRDAPSSSGQQTNLDDQIDIVAHFQTGLLQHELVGGIELARQTSALERYNNPFNSNNNWIPETPLLDPDPNVVRPYEPVSSVQHTNAPSGGAYVLDTVGLGQYFALSGGFRYDYFSASYNQLTVSSGAQLNLENMSRLGSPRAALIFKPSATQNFYFSYGTSFDPSAEALTLTTKTADLGPVKASTYEVGSKTEVFDSRLQLTGALFHTEVDNAQTNDPDNPSITVLDGDQRVEGLEIGATGYLTRHWEIYSGYTYLDGRTVAAGTAAYVGKVMPNTAHDSLNLWTEYELPYGLEAGVGANWLSSRYADSAETAYVPSYVTWGAMLSWTVNDRLALQLNGANLFNKLYYDGVYYTSAAENHLIPGTGRTGKISFQLKL